MRIGAISWAAFVLLAGAASAAGTSTQPAPTAAAGWELAGEGVTSIRFYEHVLVDLGLRVVRPASTVGGERAGSIGFRIRPESTLQLPGPPGSFQSFTGGVLQHEGGFDLVWRAGRIGLRRFELAPAPPPRTFELRSPGRPAELYLDSPHPRRLSAAEYGFFNMDVRIAEPLAETLGRPELVGTALGVADVRLAADADSLGPTAAGESCPPSPTGDVDVELYQISSVDEIHHTADRVAAAPSVGLRNVGAADVPWYRPIVPDGGGDPAVVGPHPFLVMSFYRLVGGVFHQIGRSDVKHAFFSANTDCPCSPAQILYVGCTDVYGTSTNANRTNLGPRDEVEALTGDWQSLGSHFDGVPVDDFRDHDGSAAAHPDPFEHRLVMSAADLTIPGARYFVEAWYIAAGDIDIFNSMGYREVTPTYTDDEVYSFWSFPFADAAVAPGPALDEWADPAAPPADGSAVVVDIGGAKVELAARATLLPSGLYRYDYALLNFDLDRELRSFSVPLPVGISVVDPSFRDLDADAGNDWAATVSPSEIVWQTPAADPAANALDWGTLFNFSFAANAAPAARDATLGILEPGSPSDALASTTAPGDALLPVSTLAVTRSGTGSGQVTSDPEGILCDPDCQHVYGDGTAVTLAAAADPSSKFARWKEGGVEVGTSEQHVAVMDRDRSLEAVFDVCELTLEAQQIGTAVLFEACSWIVAGAGFSILGTGDVSLRAAEWVALGDGFELYGNGRLSIEIDPSLAD